MAQLRRWSNGRLLECLHFEETIAHCGERRGIGLGSKPSARAVDQVTFICLGKHGLPEPAPG